MQVGGDRDESGKEGANEKLKKQLKNKTGLSNINVVTKEKGKKAPKDTPMNKEKYLVKATKEGKYDPQEEAKKHRYFPPKRIPNPFECAAMEQEKFLQNRKEALAKYNEISKNRYKQDEGQPFKYAVKVGNNHRLIYKVMEHSGRVNPKYASDGSLVFPGWGSSDDNFDSLFNFKWKPTSHGIKFDLISKHGLKQLVNHVNGHYHLTTKDNLFLNLKSYYESQKKNIYDVVPLTMVLDYQKEEVCDRME